MTTPPVAPSLYNSDGSVNWQLDPTGIASWSNPISFLLRKYSSNADNIISNSVITYQLIPGLEIKSSFGYNDLRVSERATLPHASILHEAKIVFSKEVSRFGKSSNSTWIVEPQVKYRRSILNGDLEILAWAYYTTK